MARPEEAGDAVAWRDCAIARFPLPSKRGGADERAPVRGSRNVAPTPLPVLVAVVLLLIPKTSSIGALLSLGVISGAIVSHLTKLGIVVKNDGGLLFALAVAVFICSAAIVAMRRRELIGLLLMPLHGGECKCPLHN